MDTLFEEQSRFPKVGDLTKSITEANSIIKNLESARARISAESSHNIPPSVSLASVHTSVKRSFEVISSNVKEVSKAQITHAKTLDKMFKGRMLPTTGYEVLATQSDLVNRAIGMHFLREGRFSVASKFLKEASLDESGIDKPHTRSISNSESMLSDSCLNSKQASRSLRDQFSDMYFILEEMKSHRNLGPATLWARSNSAALEARGSNLEFEISRLQFVWIFLHGTEEKDVQTASARQLAALEFARQEFGSLHGRYLREIQQLVGAMAFHQNLAHSPYRQIFYSNGAWEDLALSFTREFCALLGLSADSPLYIAVTAGAIALPTLQKLQTIMATRRTEWTTQNELPVEIPLPPNYRFHSIFVCPVSKEQTTDENPPMMMPCGHVVARESLTRLGKTSRFKCPYCPGESHPRDAKKVHEMTLSFDDSIMRDLDHPLTVLVYQASEKIPNNQVEPMFKVTTNKGPFNQARSKVQCTSATQTLISWLEDISSPLLDAEQQLRLA